MVWATSGGSLIESYYLEGVVLNVKNFVLLQFPRAWLRLGHKLNGPCQHNASKDI